MLCVSPAFMLQNVVFGLIKGGDALLSLLRTMHALYVPIVVGNNSWPEAVKADFTAQVPIRAA